jgi:hypothetical protein
MELTERQLRPEDQLLLGADFFNEADVDTTNLQEASAAWRLHNPVASYMEGRKIRSGFGEFDEQMGHNSYAALEDKYWEFASEFMESTSPEEDAFIKARIDSELRDRTLLTNAGGSGVLWSMAAGSLDPILAPLAVLGGAGGVSAGYGALRGAGLAFAETAVQEAALHSTQRTRTWQESMLAMGTAPLMGAALGGGIAGLDMAATRRIETIMERDLNLMVRTGGVETLEEANRSVGAAAKGGTSEQEGAAQKLYSSPVSPQLRLLNSVSAVANRFINRSSRHQIATGNNVGEVRQVRNANGELVDAVDAQGKKIIDYRENGTPVEVRSGRELAKIAVNVQKTLNASYKSYVGTATKVGARLAARRKGMMNLAEFREEVGRAMRKGDEHDVPEVKAAAQAFRETFDDIKTRSIELGLLPEGVKPKFAASYLTRVYNANYIRANRRAWDEMLLNHFRKAGGDEYSEAEAKAVASDVTNHILNHGTNPNAFELPSATAGFFKERTLNISDDVLDPYLINDIQTVMETYARKTIPEIHWIDEFGSRDIEDVLKAVDDDYVLLREGKTEAQIAKLDKQMERDKADIEAIRNLNLGRYNLPKEEHLRYVNGTRVLRAASTLAQLGGMTLSAIVDIGAIVMKNGLVGTATGFGQFARSMTGSGKASRRAMEDAGIGAEMLLQSRMLHMSELHDAPMSKMGRAITTSFGHVSLMAEWNTVMKQAAGFAAQNRFIKSIMNYDNLSALRKEILATEGIGTRKAARLKKHIEQHRERMGGGWVSNTDQWDDKVLADEFNDILFNAVEGTVVTPGLSDKPLAMQTELGKTIGQFKSFVVASHHQLLLPAMHRLGKGDLQALNGILTAVYLGMFVELSKLYAAGRQDEIDNYTMEDWYRAGIDRSGVASIPVDMFNMSDRMFEGAPSRLLGIKEGSKYFYKERLSALLGQAVSYGAAGLAAMKNLTEGDGLSTSDVHSIRKVLPYQNVFYTRWLVNQLEDELAGGRTDDRRKR